MQNYHSSSKTHEQRAICKQLDSLFIERPDFNDQRSLMNCLEAVIDYIEEREREGTDATSVGTLHQPSVAADEEARLEEEILQLRRQVEFYRMQNAELRLEQQTLPEPQDMSAYPPLHEVVGLLDQIRADIEGLQESQSAPVPLDSTAR